MPPGRRPSPAGSPEEPGRRGGATTCGGAAPSAERPPGRAGRLPPEGSSGSFQSSIRLPRLLDAAQQDGEEDDSTARDELSVLVNVEEPHAVDDDADEDDTDERPPDATGPAA